MGALTAPDLLAALLRMAATEGFPLVRLDGATDPAAPLTGRDADLLADWQAWPVWLRLVRRVAQASGWRLCLAVPRGGVMLLFLVRLRADGAPDCLQIDLHRALSARGLPYARAAAILDAARHQGGALRLDPATASDCVARGKTLAATSAAGWLRLLIDTLVRRPDLALRLWIAKLYDGVLRLAGPPGRMIAVSGPDGAGKSTLIQHLAADLPRRLAPAVRVFHTRPFLLPRLGLSAPPPPAATMTRRRTGPLRSRLRLAVALADWWVGHALVVRWHLAAGRIVLFDRYATDYRVDPHRRGIDLPPRWLRLLARVPRPALSILVVAPPTVIVARKGELDLREAERQVAAYRDSARRLRPAVLLDSGAMDPDRLAALACREIATVLSGDAHPAGA
ncbi:MAG: hypothetical protein AB7G39_02160 [Alphaproteobacteria bacterium]